MLFELERYYLRISREGIQTAEKEAGREDFH